MTTIISISNHKGGVGKTTSVVNIGFGLAQQGKKVLLIDIDAQANLSQSLGVEDTSQSIYNALKGEIKLPILEVESNLYLVPSSLDLAAAEVELSSRFSRETILKKLLDEVKNNFDYIIIDCPPSLGLITVNAFAASDKVLIPLQAQYLAMRGMDKLTDFIDLVQKNINPGLKLGGVFITQFDGRKILNRDIATSVKQVFGESKFFKTIIRENISLAEAPASNSSIFKYAPKSNGAEDYANLVEEIMSKI